MEEATYPLSTYPPSHVLFVPISKMLNAFEAIQGNKELFTFTNVLFKHCLQQIHFLPPRMDSDCRSYPSASSPFHPTSPSPSTLHEAYPHQIRQYVSTCPLTQHVCVCAPCIISLCVLTTNQRQAPATLVRYMHTNVNCQLRQSKANCPARRVRY